MISMMSDPGVLGEQRGGVPAGDEVGLDGVAQQRDAVGEVVLPERGVPLGEGIAAPDVVDEDVEAAVVVGDALDQRRT